MTTDEFVDRITTLMGWMLETKDRRELGAIRDLAREFEAAVRADERERSERTIADGWAGK